MARLVSVDDARVYKGIVGFLTENFEKLISHETSENVRSVCFETKEIRVSLTRDLQRFNLVDLVLSVIRDASDIGHSVINKLKTK